MMVANATSQGGQYENPSVAVDMSGRLFKVPSQANNVPTSAHYWMQMKNGEEQFMLVDAQNTHATMRNGSSDDELDEPFDVTEQRIYGNSPYKMASESSSKKISQLSNFTNIEPAWKNDTAKKSSRVQSAPETGSIRGLNDTMNDEDSAFDFRSKNSSGKVDFRPTRNSSTTTSSSQNQGIRRRLYQSEMDGTAETKKASQAQGPVPGPTPTDINERTLQSWRIRKERKTNLRPAESSAQKKGNNVSFGEPTLHHFQPDTTEESTCFSEERSLNSDKSKIYAGEVGDAFKDFLLIGDGNESRPGVRRINAKETSKQENTRPRKVSSSYQRMSTQTRPASGNAVDEDDPLDSVWNMVEGSMTVVASALGINEQQKAIVDQYTDNEIRKTKNQGQVDETERMTEYANLIQTGSSYNSSFSHDQEVVYQEDDEVEDPDILDGFPFPLSTLDIDPDFSKLAIHAAHSKHHLRGVKFDTSYSMDMYADIKISVVELKLPLGLILLENDGGCFVTKISPDGSAARSGGVELGDQLASINGEKSTRMSVDDIYAIIKRSRDPKSVHLAFVRYIGEIHSGGMLNGSSQGGKDKNGTKSILRVSKDEAPRRKGTKKEKQQSEKRSFFRLRFFKKKR